MDTKKIILIHAFKHDHSTYAHEKDFRVVRTYEIPGDRTFGDLFKHVMHEGYCSSYSSYDVSDPEQAAYYRESVADEVRRRPGCKVYATFPGKRQLLTVRRIALGNLP